MGAQASSYSCLQPWPGGAGQQNRTGEWHQDDTAGPETSGWDQGQLVPGPSTWSHDLPARAGDREPGPEVPGPSGLEQAVPEQLPLDREDQDSRDLQWAATSTGMDRHIDYSEDESRYY